MMETDMVNINGVTVAWIEAGTEITVSVIFAVGLYGLVAFILNKYF